MNLVSFFSVEPAVPSPPFSSLFISRKCIVGKFDRDDTLTLDLICKTCHHLSKGGCCFGYFFHGNLPFCIMITILYALSTCHENTLLHFVGILLASGTISDYSKDASYSGLICKTCHHKCIGRCCFGYFFYGNLPFCTMIAILHAYRPWEHSSAFCGNIGGFQHQNCLR